MDITIHTVHKTSEGKEEERNVTLWLNNRDNTVSLLGGLSHGTHITVNQRLVDDLQKLLDTMRAR